MYLAPLSSVPFILFTKTYDGFLMRVFTNWKYRVYKAFQGFDTRCHQMQNAPEAIRANSHAFQQVQFSHALFNTPLLILSLISTIS